MKVKEVDRTANIAWSPQSQVPIYLAAGTAAQQLDASFSTNSNLEIYGLNLSETGHDMPCLASLPVDQRFHRVVWGGAGIDDGTMPSGLIVGGADRGMISMYDAAKLVKGEADALVFSQDKHTGPVAALDFNPFQSNLLASGGSESEIYIWDVNKLGTPMTPGAKSQPLDDVRSVAWNRQVQHIMASTFASRCVVWDLRKNDPIIKVSDSTSRARYKVVAWHPDVATQLCLASEDDNTPIIQIWDLRQASSPMKVLEGHTKGVLSVAWCQADSDLLLSCGKDNRILVWNPNQGPGEVVAELPTSNQWSFEVSWCPRNPAVIASASFDGHISLYSLMGGQQQAQPTNSITESFGPGADLAQGTNSPPVTMQLKTPPKWLRRPCGATFGFGGKLVTFETPVGGTPCVFVSRVVTEPQLVEDSARLEVSLEQGNFVEFCQAKLGGLERDSNKAKLWQFVSASFGEDATTKYLDLLGINFGEIRDKLDSLLKPVQSEEPLEEEVEKVVEQVEGLGIAGPGDEFDLIALKQTEEVSPPEPTEPTVQPTPLDLTFGLGQEDALTLALLSGDLPVAVDICVKEGRFAEALILAIRAGGELLVSTQAKYFQQAAQGGSVALVEAVAMSSWERLVTNCSLDSWREVLAVLVTYTDQDTRQSLAARLADRLSASEGGRAEAMLCYVVAGSLDRVVECWMQVEGDSEPSSASSLQELVEVVVLVRAAVQTRGVQTGSTPGGGLSLALASYASLLAAQGSLSTALVYLGDISPGQDTELGQLKDRLERALARPPVAAPQRKPSGGRSTTPAPQRKASVTPAPDSRRTSMDQPGPQFSNFNTGPVANMSYNQPPVSNQPQYSQPPVSTQPQYNQPPVSTQPQYNGFTPAAPVQPYQAPAPPLAEPVQTFPPQPPSDSTPAPMSAPFNPLLRRGRALDPSVGVGGGGMPNVANMTNSSSGYNYMQQPSQPYGQFSYPDQSQQPTPSMFTPDANPAPNPPYNPPANHPTTPSMLPPPATNVNTPDHGGPGYTPVVSSGSGWNDPPLMMSRRAAQATPQVTESMSQPEPAITQPFFTPDPVVAAPSNWSGFQPAANAQFHQPAPQAPQGFQGFQPQEPAAQEVAPPPAAPEPSPPAPIPAEHQVIQDVLESLRSKCQQAASHPQVRRKLEDVSTKLDILYNKLRAASLSPATLQGLHTILQHIWQYDYPSCMQVISGLIAGGSFAEMSDFMPGVKVLLQVAQQQGVYVEYQQ